MKHDFHIRSLSPSDIDQAVAIIEQNYPEEKYGIRARKELEAAFHDGAMVPHYIVCVNNNGEIIGFGGCIQSWMDYDIFEIFWLNVRKDVQGTGIGSALRKQLAVYAKSQGAKTLLFTTTSIKSYEQSGCTVLQELSNGYYLVSKQLGDET